MSKVPVESHPVSGPREVVTGVTFLPSSLHQALGWQPELAVWPQHALGRSSRISSSPELRMMSFTGNPPGQLGSRGRRKEGRDGPCFSPAPARLWTAPDCPSVPAYNSFLTHNLCKVSMGACHSFSKPSSGLAPTALRIKL